MEIQFRRKTFSRASSSLSDYESATVNAHPRLLLELAQLEFEDWELHTWKFRLHFSTDQLSTLLNREIKFPDSASINWKECLLERQIQLAFSGSGKRVTCEVYLWKHDPIPEEYYGKIWLLISAWLSDTNQDPNTWSQLLALFKSRKLKG